MGSTAATMALRVGMDYMMKNQQAKASNRAAQAQADAQSASIRRAREINERRKRDALKQVTATQRARFGAQGAGGRGGSADAVLSGLARPYEESIEDARLIADAQMRRIQNNLDYSKRVNLLEASNPVRQLLYDNIKRRIPTVMSLLD